jgi:hypothetical protein
MRRELDHRRKGAFLWRMGVWGLDGERTKAKARELAKLEDTQEGWWILNQRFIVKRNRSV